MEPVIIFILTFLAVFIVYQFIFLKDYKDIQSNKKSKKSKKENNKKRPVEVRLLESYYKVEVEKLNYSNLLNMITFVSSLDISFIVTIICIFKNGIFQILVACILVVPVIYISYWLLAFGLKKKILREERKK